MTGQMTYKGAGVDYDAMDPFKRMCQMAGRETAGNIARLGGGEFREFEPSRGESVYVVETPDSFLAHVEEGLGTKNLAADAVQELTGRCYYDHIAQDTVAMIVNDMITLGALPLSVAMHLAAGSTDWFKDKVRLEELVKGWKIACDLSGCIWGGGETPTLKDIIAPKAAVISGSGMGIIKPKGRLIRGDVRDGDAIIFAESNGIHANGLTLARRIAEKIPDGYVSKIGGRNYGEILLDSTHIYVRLVEACLDRGVDIHYAVNITGHGWRKLMRANTEEQFAYVIDKLPWQQPIFDFLQEHGPIDDREAYGNLNMGVGFALIVPEEDVPLVLKAYEETGPTNLSQRYRVYEAGHVEKSKGKKVVIDPKAIVFEGDTLGVR